MIARAAQTHPNDHGGAPCAHAERRSRSAQGAIARAEAACRARGARLTAIRRDVLAALHATHRPLGAYEIADRLADEQPDRRRLAPIAIYRALEFLIAQGFVHRLASRNAFVACPGQHGGSDCTVFLICEGCGGVDEVSPAGLSQSVGRLLAEEGFEPHLQVLEITGRCSHCRRDAGPPA